MTIGYTISLTLQLQAECSNENTENYRVLIRERVHGWSLPPPRCRGSLLLDLAHQVKQLKEELIAAKISGISMHLKMIKIICILIAMAE